LLAGCALVSVLSLGTANAQDEIVSPFEDHFRLTVAFLSMSSETELRLDADDGSQGTLVSAEADLGLREQSEQADVEAELRIRERHRIRFGYFRLDRSAAKTIDRQILFGNEVFDAGDLVESRLDWREFSITYGYTFLRTAHFELYGSFGLHLVEMSAQGEVAADDIREEESEAAPIPALGLGTLVRFSDRFHGEARVDYLTANVDQFDGTVLDARAAVLYRFNRNLAVGAAYMLMEREGNSEDIGDSGHFSLKNSGPELFMRVAF
jgi:hypothetical protein